MRLLFDQNLSFKLCDRVADLFPGSSQARLIGLDRANDRTLWSYAGAHGFTLVSQDADFADMAALYGPPPRVILLRGGNRSTASVERALRGHATLIMEFGDDADSACLEIA